MQSSLKLGEEIRKVRKKLKKEQKEFAGLLGITNVHLSNLENGKKMPSPELLKKIWNYLGEEVPETVNDYFEQSRNAGKTENKRISSDLVYQLQEQGLYTAKKLKELLRKDPENLSLILALLNLLKEEKKEDEAREHLLSSLKNIRVSEQRKWLEAAYFMLEKNFILAIDLLLRAIKELQKKEVEKEKRAGLFFELANVYYEYGYYCYNQENDRERARENFAQALFWHQKIEKEVNEPYYELYYANIFWWLAFLGENPEENWLNYINRAENVLLINHEFKMKNRNALYSEPFMLQLISGLAEAYAKIGWMKQKSEQKEEAKVLFKQGELLLAQHAPIGILPQKKEFYNFYFGYACFFALKAESKAEFGEDFSRELNFCSLGLQQAWLGDQKNESGRFLVDLLDAGEKELLFYRLNKKDDFNYFKDKNND